MTDRDDKERLQHWQAKVEDKVLDVVGRLVASGWIHNGGWDMQTGMLDMSFVLDAGQRVVTPEMAQPFLPIFEADESLAAGYELAAEPETGQVSVGYRGVLDERFEAVVDAMISVGADTADDLDRLTAEVFRDPIGRLAYLGAQTTPRASLN